jgi:hypothetical protein
MLFPAEAKERVLVDCHVELHAHYIVASPGNPA